MADKRDIEETPQDSTLVLATSGMRVTVSIDAIPEDRFIKLDDLKTALSNDDDVIAMAVAL